MTKNKNTKKFGLFYKSHGKWTTVPYAGVTYTAYQLGRNPVKQDVADLKNYILKSRIRVMPVAA